MKCDRCGWRTSKKEYNGSGECFACFDGLMIEERRKKEKNEK